MKKIKEIVFTLIVIIMWILSIPFAIWAILVAGGDQTAGDFIGWMAKMSGEKKES